jgi:hypothetical protein
MQVVEIGKYHRLRGVDYHRAVHRDMGRQTERDGGQDANEKYQP